MKKQSGNALVVVIIILSLVIIGALGFLFWQNMQKSTPNAATDSTSESNPSDTQDAFTTYKSSEIGVEFTYPKSWVSLSCEGKVLAVYFATDSRGINESALCGGGSDYPPQMSFTRITNDQFDDSYAQTSKVSIDGKEATKAIYISDSESIRPEGFKTIVYSISTGLREPMLQITYNKWPVSYNASYDTSDASEVAFTELVETRMKILDL